MSETYNGWKNYNTWNVAFHCGENPNYEAVVEFMKDYKGENPYKDFLIESGLDSQRTSDGVRYISDELDYPRLNEMMKEMK